MPSPQHERTYERVGLSDLVRRLLEPSLRRVDAPVAVVNVLLHVPHVVVLEAIPLLLCRRAAFPVGLERLAVDLRALAQILLRVCEQVVWACPCNIRPAYFRVCQGQLCAARRGPAAHELVCTI